MLVASTRHVEDCPDLGPACAQKPGPTPYVHHVDLFASELGLDASYGIAPWLALEARLGLRIVKITPTYSELDGTPKSVPNDIHHHDETLVGPTDPWLVVRTGGALGKLVTAARLGVTLPLGRTEPDPYVLAAAGQSHEHIQFGTGTVVPIVGGGLAYRAAPVELSLSALAFFSLYANDKGFRAPSRWLLSTRATLPLGGGAFRPYVAADLTHEGRETWHGAPGSESTTRTDLLLGGGVSWEFAPPWSVDLGLRARTLHAASGATFDYPGILQLGLSTHFGLERVAGAK